MHREVFTRRNHVWAGKWKLAGLLMLLSLALARTAGAADTPPGKWSTDTKTAFAQAEADHKPILMMFSTSWCAPCNMMKRDVFTLEKVKGRLDEVAAVYIDGDANRDLLKQYKVHFFPTFVVLKSNGSELGRFVGFNDSEKFLKKLDIVQVQLPKLELMLSTNAKDPVLWQRRGKLYEALENPEEIDEVARSYRRAQSLDPDNRTGAAVDSAFFEAARVSGGDADAADQRFADFIAKNPGNPRVEDALFNRLDIAMREGKTDQAKALLKEYQEKYPTGKYVRATDEITSLLSQPRPPQGTVRVTPRAGGTAPAPAPVPVPPAERPAVPRGTRM